MGSAPSPPRLAGARPSGFVGREAELSLLASIVDGVDAEHRAALIEGVIGVGKTALLSRVMAEAEAKGIRVLRASCYQVQEAGPYFPFRQIARQLRGERGLPPFVQKALRRVHGTAADDPAERRARFLNALTDLLIDAASSQHSLLAVEDIQWADTGSLLLLNDLLDTRPSGLAVLCTARSDQELEPDTAQLVGRFGQRAQRVLLHPLSVEETGQFVESMVGNGVLTSAELETLRAFTGGNPLFLQGLLSHFEESGILTRHSIAEAIRRSRTPRALSHVVDLRLRSLPPGVRSLLSLCAVLGMELPVPLLARITRGAEVRIEASLEIAAGQGVVVRSDSLPEPGFRFAHPLFRMRLYEELPAVKRRRLHRRIADAMSGPSGEFAIEEVAWHSSMGSRPIRDARAADLCRAAAEQAEAVFAYETAARFWELALGCTAKRQDAGRAELYERLGRALWSASKWEQAVEAWGRAVVLLDTVKACGRAASLRIDLGETCRWLQRLPASERHLRRAITEAALPTELRARALALLGSVQCLRDRSAEGLRLLGEADALARGTTAEPITKYWLSYGLLTSGQWPDAVRVARAGLAAARRWRDGRTARLLAATLTHHQLSALRLHSARRYSRIVSAAVDAADTVALTYSLVSQSTIAAYQGDWRLVVDLCERWSSQVRLVGPYYLATARMHWAVAQLALGRPAAAREEIERALPNLESLRPLGELHLAQALLELGDHARAESLVSQNLSLASRSRRLGAGLIVLADVGSRLATGAPLEHCYELLQAEQRPLIVVYGATSVQRVLGRLATRMGRWEAAIRHLDIAINQLNAGGAKWELAQAYLDYAELWRARRRRGDAQRATSLQMMGEEVLAGLGIAFAARPPDGTGRANRFALTNRELEILALVAEGHRNPEIASLLIISRRTVERHVENILRKLDCGSRTEAVVRAMKEGLVGPLARRADAQPERPAIAV